MALRKQVKHFSSDSQQMDEDTQEDDSATDGDTGDEFSSLLLSSTSTREKRWRKLEKKAINKTVGSEMTEEEMMDLALRLSEREASASALQRQQEEEAVMKAIQESMVSQTQPCLNSSSKPLRADASLGLGSRRKLFYSNGVKMSATDQAVPEDGSTPETDLTSEAKGAGDENIPCKKKRKRKAGSPLLEMPDLSVSQKVSPDRVEPSSAPLDSPQSSDSTQIDDSQLHMSPVFPLTGCRAVVHIDRLSQDMVETCRSSGFVLCSQDSWNIEPRSPTFPRSNAESCPKSPVFSGTGQVDNGQVEPSPAFVRKAQHETSPSCCKRHDCENSEVEFSSQDSLSLSVRSCCSKSPVFPKSSQTTNILPPSDGLSFHKSLAGEQAEENGEQPVSPVFGTTQAQRRTFTHEQKTPVASELRGSDREEKLDGKEETKSDGCQADEFYTRPSTSEQLTQKSKDGSRAETKLLSDMTLAWTDEDEDDNTLADSASPVFPEEKPLPQGQAASLTHEAAASQGQTSSDCRKQLPTTDEEICPTSKQREEVCRESPPPGESSGGPTVHYYWGVPFCPGGLDPDTYTQVILAQMEVYQTSLKRAQRCLLRKAEWGEAVLPEPEKSPSPEAPASSPQLQFPRRRGLRLRGRKINEAAESSPAEEEERMEEEEQQQEKEETNEGDEEQMDDDCDVCPETQLSNDDAPELTVVTDAEADISSQPPPKSPESPTVERILQHSSPNRDELQEEEEEAMDAKTKENVSSCSGDAGSRTAGEARVKEDSRDPDGQETKSGRLQRSASLELELAVVPRSPDTSVDCPICQASFPASDIELHAAYCDGEVAIVGEMRPDGHRFQESVKLPRKRTRRAERTPEGTNDSSDICRKREMCYVCRKAVALREYSRHTELCLQSHSSRPKGNLLMALAQTENRDSDAGPSGSKVQPEAVIDLRDDDDDDEAASAFRISDSPIRSFTSISEATGCLIDFKKQHRPKKPGQRRR